MIKEKKNKIILFDLNTEKLKQPQKYGEKNYTKAYADIKNFFKKNDFKHIQGSAYISKAEMTDIQTFQLLKKLIKACPKIIGCVSNLSITNAEDNHNATIMFDEENKLVKSIRFEHSAPDKTDTMEYYEAEIAKRQKQRQQLPHGEDIALEKPKQDKER